MLIMNYIHLQDGESALFIASRKGDIKVVKLLLEFGAQVNLQTSVRCTRFYGFFCCWSEFESKTVQ